MTEISKAKKKARRRLEALRVNEISFVDNPAVPEAVFAIVKRDDSEEGTAMQVELKSREQAISVLTEVAKSAPESVDMSKVFVEVSKQLSHGQVHEMLYAALKQMYPPPADEPYCCDWYICEVFDEFFIYEKEGKLYRMGYMKNDSGIALVAEEPMQVRRVVSYEPIGFGVAKSADAKQEASEIVRRFDDGGVQIVKFDLDAIDRLEKARALLNDAIEQTQQTGVVSDVSKEDDSENTSSADDSGDAAQTSESDSDASKGRDATEVAAEASGATETQPDASGEAQQQAQASNSDTPADAAASETAESDVQKSDFELAAEKLEQRRKEREDARIVELEKRQRESEAKAIDSLEKLTHKLEEVSKKLDDTKESVDVASGKKLFA